MSLLVAKVLAHALSLVACWAGSAERPTSARASGRVTLRRAGPLYQI